MVVVPCVGGFALRARVGMTIKISVHPTSVTQHNLTTNSCRNFIRVQANCKFENVKLKSYIIANKTANIAENIVYIVFVRTFRRSTGSIVNAKDQTHTVN